MTNDRFGTPLNIGDWVKVVARSNKYNAHIDNVGYVGEIVEVWEDGIQIECLNGGIGAIDANAVKRLDGKPSEADIFNNRYDRY